MPEMLINIIQECPALWDKRNKNYHNRLLTYSEWEEVAKVIGTITDEAKKKWKNLRDTYAKEFKKIPKPRSGADADNEPKYTGTWPYFESLSFLKVILKPRKTDGNILPEHSVEGYSMDFSDSTCTSPVVELDMNMAQNNFDSPTLDDNHDSELQVSEFEQSKSVMPSTTETRKNDSTSSDTSTPTNTRRQKRKQKDVGLEEFLELERDKLKVLRQDQQDNKDDDLFWFKSILPYMKQLPSLNKLKFRTQMQELLFKKLSMSNTYQVPQQEFQNSFFPTNYTTL